MNDSKECLKARWDWANSKYEEKVDWTKVKKDTPVLVRNHQTDCWNRRYFAEFRDNHVYVYNDGCTSWSASSKGWWQYTKLSLITDKKRHKLNYLRRINMTNKEKYAKEILDVACSGHYIAKIDGKITVCEEIDCAECDFGDRSTCRAKLEKWTNSEYVEPQVDWSKVAVDTPILVSTTEDSAWAPRYFAKYENGRVYAWSNGSTSWSAEGTMCVWEFAKLAKSEE